MAAAVTRFGRIGVLFNNAGVEFVSSIEEMPEDKWDLVVDTNLKGIYMMSKAAIPHMIRQGGGTIVNTASQLGWVGVPRFSAYCASKGGIVNLTRAMALELAPHGIRVNALCPGAVETPLLLRQFEGGRSGPQGSFQSLAVRIWPASATGSWTPTLTLGSSAVAPRRWISRTTPPSPRSRPRPFATWCSRSEPIAGWGALLRHPA